MIHKKTVFKKLLRGPDKGSQWAGLGPQAALCQPLVYTHKNHNISNHQVKKMKQMIAKKPCQIACRICPCPRAVSLLCKKRSFF